MSQNGILIANNIQGRLIKVEVMGRDSDGQISEGIEVELAHGEFQEIAVPTNGMLQIVVKDN